MRCSPTARAPRTSAQFNVPADAILFDAVWDTGFREKLFRLMQDRQRADGKVGQLVGAAHESLTENIKSVLPKSEVLVGEQSNSSMLFEDKFFLKLYRKLEDGVNPDVEVTRFLTERSAFQNVPAFGGAIEYRRAPKNEPTVVCLLQNAIASECDGWKLTLDSVGRFYDRVLAKKGDLQNETTPEAALLDELIGGLYPEKAKVLEIGRAHV